MCIARSKKDTARRTRYRVRNLRSDSVEWCAIHCCGGDWKGRKDASTAVFGHPLSLRGGGGSTQPGTHPSCWNMGSEVYTWYTIHTQLIFGLDIQPIALCGETSWSTKRPAKQGHSRQHRHRSHISIVGGQASGLSSFERTRLSRSCPCIPRGKGQGVPSFSSLTGERDFLRLCRRHSKGIHSKLKSLALCPDGVRDIVCQIPSCCITVRPGRGGC